MAFITRQVSASANNLRVEYFSAEIQFWLSESSPPNIRIGMKVADGGAYYKLGGGYRFLNIPIKQGTVIKNAYLTVTASSSSDTEEYGDANSVIAGNDEDNAGVFSDLADYQSSCGTRCGGANNDKRTTASVDWNAIEPFTIDEEYQSPDISSVVQEIIDRPNWQSGNSLVLFWEDHGGDWYPDSPQPLRTVYGYDGSAAKAVKLHIEYQSSGLFTFHG